MGIALSLPPSLARAQAQKKQAQKKRWCRFHTHSSIRQVYCHPTDKKGHTASCIQNIKDLIYTCSRAKVL
jgi:hypothetical protein